MLKLLHEKGNAKLEVNVLHKAADSCMDKPKLIEYIVSKGIAVNGVNEQGMSAFHKASCAGKLNTMRTLIKLGADVNQADIIGFQPLHMAIYIGKLRSVKLLLNLENIDVNAKLFSYFSPVDIAKIRGYKSIVDYLEQKGASRNLLNANLSSALFYGTLNVKIKRHLYSTHEISFTAPEINSKN